MTIYKRKTESLDDYAKKLNSTITTLEMKVERLKEQNEILTNENKFLRNQLRMER